MFENDNKQFTRSTTLNRWQLVNVVTFIAIGSNVLSVSNAQVADESLVAKAHAVFGRIEEVQVDIEEQLIVELGQRLFWDERLSVNGKVACASCHAASAWGADTQRFSVDAKDKLTKRNSQTVFNAMLQPKLRWTADRNSGAHQAERSLIGSMGFAKAEDIIPLLVQYNYESQFKQAFPQDETSLSPANYAKAIEAYETTLTTPAAFDRYLAGDAQALNGDQKEGLRIFIEIGCANCHSGKLIGGEGIEKFGVHDDYWTLTKSQTRDEGLFESSKNEADKFHFRVSMLRNIEKTGPYFHDGSIANLNDAVRIMAKLQLDEDISESAVHSVVEFLTTLTGSVPANYSKPIDLPPTDSAGQ
jgi:cytochrome c peroxidase